MTTRRQFLGMGIAAAVWPGWMTAFGRPSLTGGPVEPARLPLYKAIYDTDYASAVEFAAQMRRRGVAVHAIERDITSVWFNDLALQWRQRPGAIAGLTAPAGRGARGRGPSPRAGATDKPCRWSPGSSRRSTGRR